MITFQRWLHKLHYRPSPLSLPLVALSSIAVVVAVAVGVGVKGGYIDSHRQSPLSLPWPLQLPLAVGLVTLSRKYTFNTRITNQRQDFTAQIIF